MVIISTDYQKLKLSHPFKKLDIDAEVAFNIVIMYIQDYIINIFLQTIFKFHEQLIMHFTEY